MTKKRYLSLLIFIIIFFSLYGGFASALEINDYPKVPGLIAPSSDCTGDDCLSIYVAYWFGLLVYLAGAVSLISFAVGAVGLINPNIEAHKDAKDRMKGAILGLVLVFASFIIIKTINVNLITPTLTPLPGVSGIFYTNGSEERKPVGLEVPDTSTRPQGFDSITYDCIAGQEGGAPALLIWEFDKAGFQGKVHVARIICEEIEPIAGYGSFQMAFETPGVYYCYGVCGSEEMCSGNMSSAHTTSEDIIDPAFRGQIGGVRIVNDQIKDLYYGAIFHDLAGLAYGGGCNFPITNTGDGGKCRPVTKPDQTAAVDIFKLNKNEGESGDGVIFYSKSFGWNTGIKAGSYNVYDDQIPFPSSANSNDWPPDTMCFDYSIKMPKTYMYKCKESACGGSDYSCQSDSNCDEYENEICDIKVGAKTGVCVSENGQGLCSEGACETFQDCPGSIRIKGSYLVALYSKKGSGSSSNSGSSSSKKSSLYCQVFTQNVENLDAKSFLEPGATKKDLLNVYIIPTK